MLNILKRLQPMIDHWEECECGRHPNEPLTKDLTIALTNANSIINKLMDDLESAEAQVTHPKLYSQNINITTADQWLKYYHGQFENPKELDLLDFNL